MNINTSQILQIREFQMENSNHQLHVLSNDHHNNKNAHENKIHSKFSNKGNIFLLPLLVLIVVLVLFNLGGC